MHLSAGNTSDDMIKLNSCATGNIYMLGEVARGDWPTLSQPISPT